MPDEPDYSDANTGTFTSGQGHTRDTETTEEEVAAKVSDMPRTWSPRRDED